MFIIKPNLYIFINTLFLLLLTSCNKLVTDNNYKAFFGGEVTNANYPYILFCKNSKVIDTIPLKKDNTFFKEFDSLTPGMYSFKNEQEYQYVFFDKNDSLMVHINSKDFDESIVFCGRGDEKNNFLMELYLKNEKDKEKIFTAFNYDCNNFDKTLENIYKSNLSFYKKHKCEIDWSEDFDIFAKAALDYNYYSKKELYPVVHKIITGIDITNNLPKNFFKFRHEIDFNNAILSGYSPYMMYLSNMLNNLGSIKFHNHYSDLDLALNTNINKLKIADSLFKNKAIKDVIINNIAFSYLLEDQNIVNNKKFFDTYYKYASDKTQKNEILKINAAIQLLKTGNILPEVILINKEGSEISSKKLFQKPSVVFFWTEKANSHFLAAHKKALELKLTNPNYEFYAINLDKDQKKWIDFLSKHQLGETIELRCNDFEQLKSKWAITKIHRTIIIGENCNIKNAFINLFDVNFEKNL